MERNLIGHWASSLIVSYQAFRQSSPIEPSLLGALVLLQLSQQYRSLREGEGTAYSSWAQYPIALTDLAVPAFVNVAGGEPQREVERFFLKARAKRQSLDWFAGVIVESMDTYSGGEHPKQFTRYGNLPGAEPLREAADFGDFLKAAVDRQKEDGAARLRADQEREDWVKRETEKGQARAQNRQARVGEKSLSGVEPESVDWEAMTPERMAELVYQHPTTVLAVMCGVSDVAIAKYCKKHSIEKPPRGYWQKQQASSGPSMS